MSGDFEQFVKERIYLKNVSPRTVDFYRDCWRSFERYGGELSKPGFEQICNCNERSWSKTSFLQYVQALTPI